MKMNKLFFTVALTMMLSMVGCSSCTKAQDVNPIQPTPAPTLSGSSTVVVPPLPVPTSRVVSGTDWTLKLPSSFVVLPPNNPDVDLLAKSEELGTLLFVVREPFDGTYNGYALLTMRGLKEDGANVVSADEVIVNNTSFVKFVTNKKDLSLSIWTTVDEAKHFGYGFSCGGKTVNFEEVDKSCNEVIKTFIIHE